MEGRSEYRACAVCERTILRGERISEYVADDGEEVTVCALCRPRAEASGWVPASEAETRHAPLATRRRPVLAQMRELRSRLPVRGRRGEHPPEAEPPAPPAPPPPPRTALDVFNESREVRKVAGLLRTLGEPRVSVRPGEGGSEVITVAWDLSWYQWSVSSRSGEIKQVGKGNEISELPVSDRDWNARAAEDGTLGLA